MAFLQNLIVTGGSKFLNKIYATDIEVNGTFETSGNLSVGGTLSVTGTSTLKGITTTSISNVGTLRNEGSVELFHATPFIDFHYNKSTTDYTSRIIESGSGTITITPNLKVGTSATIPTATITTANISTSNMSTGIAENLNVTNKLHATHFDLQSVAQLGGAFYVSPTIKFPTNSSTTFTVTKNGATANIIISDSAINSTTIAGVVWGANAKIKASGKIGTITTGTMDGTVTGINTSNHTLTISVSGENSSSIITGTYTSANIDNFCVMMYNTGTYPVGIMMNSYGTDGRTYIDIHGGTSSATEPNVRIGNLGGLSFNGTTLSNQWGIYTNNGYYTGSIVANGGKIGGFTIGSTAIYTGTLTANSDNNIGLSSADFTRTIGGTSRTGLRFAIGDKVGITGDGILYTHNLQATGGKIGGWTISSADLHNVTSVTAGTASTQYGTYIATGTSNTTKAISAGSRSYDGTNYGNWDYKFYVRNDGYMYAVSGSIGGWSINTNRLAYGTIGTADGVYLIPAGSTDNYSIGGSESINNWTITSGANFGVTASGALYCSDIYAKGEITATSGYIGNSTNGFTIDSSGFYSGTKTGNTSGYISLSNSNFTRTINGTSVSSLRFAIGSKFGVTSDGTLYANGLNIKNIDADNISIGTLSIERLTSLQIGGRNLFKDSEKLGSSSWAKENGTVSEGIVTLDASKTSAVRIYQMPSYGYWTWQANQSYTLSIDAKASRDGLLFYFNAVGLSKTSATISLTTEWKRYTWTVIGTSATDGSMSFYAVGGQNGTIQFKNPQLELGNKATDWSPAPEDVDNSINQAQTTADTATTKIDNLKKPQLGWKVNYSAYTQVNNGECYFHGYNSNNAIADVDGKVDWNGEELTITKGMWINPNQSAPYNTPILHVYRTSTAPYHADVWWDNDLGKWRGYMYKTDKTPDVRVDWVWNEATDCILATYIEPSSDGEIQSAQLFNPPKKYSELPDPSVSYNLDNLKIGGRNLLLNTATEKTGASNVAQWMQWAVSNSPLIANEDYMLSFDAKMSNSTDVFYIGFALNSSTQEIMKQEVLVTDTYKRYIYKVKTTKTNINSIIISNAKSYNRGNENNTTGTLSIKNIKLEKGNKATNWTPAPEDVDSAISDTRDIANTALSQGVEYIVGTQTATTASWTGVTTDSTLVAGKTIAYKLPQTSASNATLNLTLSTGATTGAKAVYYNTTRVSTEYPANSIIHMTYDGSYWRITNYNSDTQNRIRLQNVITAAEAITAGHIICGTSSGYRDIKANISFDLTYPLLYAGTAKAKGGTSDNNYLSINAINASSNGTITSGATKKTLYLKGTVNNNTFTISASPFMTTVVPTTEDGFIYIPLGIMYSASNIYFISSDKLYAYKDGGFKELSRGEASLAAKTATNYLYYDTTNGLVISSSASSQTYSGASTGYNTRLTNSALQIRNGTNVLASYGSTVTIGELNKAHQVLDGSSLNFISYKGESLFEIKDLSNTETFSSYEFGYMDNASTATASSISSALADALNNIDDSYRMSSSGDYVDDTRLSDVSVEIFIFGNTEEELITTEGQSIQTTSKIVENGILTVSLANTTSSTWTNLATTFLNKKPTGTTFNTIGFKIKITYPITGIAMTFGNRNTEQYANIGMGSVSMGENNIVSGRYSYAFGQDITNVDDYSCIVGEGNAPIINTTTGERQEVSFAVGANGTTPFAVLKNGTIMMSSVNTGRFPDEKKAKYSRTDYTVTFQSEYPTPPFIFLTLCEDYIPNNQNDIIDYGRMQIYLKEVTTTGFTATVVNGSDTNHNFGFNWFAISTADVL